MKRIAIYLGGSALAALSLPAHADDAAIVRRLDALQHTVEAQQHQIDVQNAEIRSLRKALGHGMAAAPPQAPATPMAEPAMLARQQAKIDTLSAKLNAVETEEAHPPHGDARLSLKGGYPEIRSADGRFTLGIHVLGQYDLAYYAQGARAAAGPAPDLSSGGNFRRAYLGVRGTAFGDWAYDFNYNFGGTGHEGSGSIQSVYIEYGGLKNFAFRLGAYPTPAGLDDQTPAGGTLFLERAAPADLARALAGADGRDSATLFYRTKRVLAALSITGDKIGDTGAFDEQQAFLGRLAGLVYDDADTKILLSANGTYIFKPADLTPGANALHDVTLSAPPELTVDDNGLKLVSSGALNAAHVSEWGMEGAAQWRSLYGQAGYFGYAVDRATSSTPLADLNFSGWYAQASWVLTGERRSYSAAYAAFSNPKPDAAFSAADCGCGAWEIAARYSELDLNDNAGLLGVATPMGGIRGGDQKIVTLGLNWYPNTMFRFLLDYQNIDVGRLNASGGDAGQRINTVALRSQIQF